MKSSIFEEGAAARRAGLATWDNPYMPGEDSAAYCMWLRGFNCAHA